MVYSDSEVKELINSGRYWVLYTKDEDWCWVLDRLLERFFGDEPSGKQRIVLEKNGVSIYLINKREVPASEIAYRTGKEVKEVQKNQGITLKSVPLEFGTEDIRPTTDEWGTA